MLGSVRHPRWAGWGWRDKWSVQRQIDRLHAVNTSRVLVALRKTGAEDRYSSCLRLCTCALQVKNACRQAWSNEGRSSRDIMPRIPF